MVATLRAAQVDILVSYLPVGSERVSAFSAHCALKAKGRATITHRVLTKLLADRGVRLDRTYQLNTGANMAFQKMLERSRLTSKKISKTGP